MLNINRSIWAMGLLIVVLAACGKSPEVAILGKWYETGGDESMQFYEDGTIAFEDNGEIIAGNYSFLDDETIRVELGGIGALTGPLVIGVQLDGDSLTLALPDKTSESYTRTPGAGSAFSESEETTGPTIAKQVSEGLNMSAGAKAAVTEYFHDNGRFPTSNAEAGVSEANQITGRYVSSVAVTSGLITVTYGGDESDVSITGKTLLIRAKEGSGYLQWSCSSQTIASQYLPAACR